MFSKSGFETLTRIGFAARGIMYLAIGTIALRTRHAEDGAGALEYLSGGSGRLLLAAMAVGFLFYAFWRLSEAAIDSENHGSDAKGRLVRAGGAVSGLIHLGLFYYAALLASGERRDDGGGTLQGASATLDLPGGQLALAIAAIALAGTGLYQLVKAWRRGFLKYLEPEAARRHWVMWLGRAGYAARGITFLIMGWFLWKAAKAESAAQAGDMGRAIDFLPETARTLVAAGLFLFGLFSLIEAVYRRINDPHVLARLQGAARERGFQAPGP